MHYAQAIEDYNRVEKAIRFIEQNFQRQPDLKEVAASIGHPSGDITTHFPIQGLGDFVNRIWGDVVVELSVGTVTQKRVANRA